VSPTHIVGVVASSLDYAGLHGLYVLDRRDGVEVRTKEAVVPFAIGSRQPPHSGRGRVTARGGGVEVLIDQSPAASRVRAHTAAASVDLTVPVVPGRDALGVVIPWSDRRFQLTV